LRGDRQNARRPDKVFDVEWAPETKKLFDVSIKLVVLNQRGVLAKVAADIAKPIPTSTTSRSPPNRAINTRHAVHAAGVEPPASGADHARTAPHPEVIRIARVKS